MKTAEQKLQEILNIVSTYDEPGDEAELMEDAACNGNFDDAFQDGVTQGECSLAQQIKEIAEG